MTTKTNNTESDVYIPKKCVSEYSYAVGQNIKKYRIIQGLSQHELAGLMGMSMETVRKQEAGSINISLRQIEDYARYLNVSVFEILNTKSAFDFVNDV